MCLVCIKTTLELGFESNKSLMHLHQVEKTAVIMNTDYTPNIHDTTLILDQTWLKGKVNLYAASKDIYFYYLNVFGFTHCRVVETKTSQKSRLR